VLATNIDILVGDDVFTFMKDGLRGNALYRVDRYDVLADLNRVPLPSPAECRSLPVIRQHTLDGMRYPPGSTSSASRSIWRPESFAPSRVVMAAWDRLVLPRLHTLACGDFTLTSKEIWNSLRGYPEWPVYSWQLDGVPMFQAYAAGVDMVNLPPPMAVFHLEHGEGSGWTPEGSRRLFGRLDAAGIPYLTTEAYRKVARKLVRGRGFQPLNDPDWGLASVELATSGPTYNSVG
jgi:hypothetical protein